jgi:hypothetical protein
MFLKSEDTNDNCGWGRKKIGGVSRQFISDMILLKKDVEVIIANKYNLKHQISDRWLRASLKEILVNAIPIISSLNNPTIKEIVDELDAKVLFGGSAVMKSGTLVLEPYLCCATTCYTLKRECSVTDLMCTGALQTQ